jgi:flagellar protein FlgJ
VIEDKSAAGLAPPQLYTDLSGLQQLKALGRVDKGAALNSIAHQFESMMVQMMMKSMREANSSFADGDMTSSSEEKFYQEMFDSQLSLSVSRGRGMGIAAAFMRQFQSRLDPVAAGADAARPADFSAQDLTRRQVMTALGEAAPAGADAAAIQDAIYRLFGTDATDADAAARDGENADAASFDGTPADFVNTLRPLAQDVAEKLGVDSRILLSQAALETGWGQKVLRRSDGSSSFNFFNIKADANWQGAVVTVPVVEYRGGVAVRETANFRAYRSAEESFADYARLIAQNPRYQAALAHGDNSRAYIRALAAAGYATDPRYAEKVLAVLGNDEVQQGPGDNHAL